MEKIQKPSRFPGILLITGSVIGIIFWFIMLFFALFLGGSPGPYSEGRTVPLHYVAVIGLGSAGAIVSLVAGIKSIRDLNAAISKMVVLAALFGIAGSVPFFLLDVAVGVGLVALMFGIAFPLAYLIITRKTGWTKQNREQTDLKPTVPGILLVTGSAIGVLYWFFMLLFALVNGIPVIGLGFIGAIVGLIASIKSMRGASAAISKMVVLAALFGIAGSVPFFLLEEAVMGFAALAFGIVFPVAYLFKTRITGQSGNISNGGL